MRTTALCALLATLSACGADDGLDPDGDGKGDRGGRCARPQPDIAGVWEIETAFDLPMPAEPWDEPLLYIIEYMESQLGGSLFEERFTPERYPDIAAAFRRDLPAESAALDAYARNFAQARSRFGLVSRLEIGARRATCDYDARLVVHGASWRIEGQTEPVRLPLSALGIGEIVVDGVRVSGDWRNGKIDIVPFSLPLDLGALRRGALETMLPTDLLGFLEKQVPCYDAPSLPNVLVTALPDPGGYDSLNAACPEALGVLVKRMDKAFAAMKVTLDLSGTARVEDTNADGVGDALRDGRWQGSLVLQEARTPLAGDQEFLGSRP